MSTTEQSLEFGTAGVRAIMGDGPYRINKTTIARLALAIAQTAQENISIKLFPKQDSRRLFLFRRNLNPMEISPTFRHPIRRTLIICTIVSTPLAQKVAKRFGAHYRETLTGFKWMAQAEIL